MDSNKRISASIDMTRVLFKYAAETGIDPAEIYKESGLEPAVLENKAGLSGARISIDQFNAAWNATALRAKDKDFGLHLGEKMLDFHMGHILFAVMMNSPNVGEAIEKFLRYHCLMADIIQPRLQIRAGFALFTWDMATPEITLHRYHSEAIMSLFITIFRRLIEQRVEPTEIRFRHPEPVDTSEHQRIFRAPLWFKQPRNQIKIKQEYLSLPVFSANPALLPLLERFIRGLLDSLYSTDTWVDRVNRLIGNMLTAEVKPAIETIAGKLEISSRNLQNKLKEEGTSFQKLLDQVRKEMALSYLKNKDLSLLDIAFLLGFSEQSAFNHAFKRWTGTIPRQYRSP